MYKSSKARIFLSMNGFYVFKWWLLAVALLAPVAIIISSVVTGGEYQMGILAIPWGLMFSIPWFLCLLILFYFLHKWNVPQALTKWALNFGAIPGILITFYLVFDSVEGPLPIIYVFSTLVSSLFCRISEEQFTSPFDIHSRQSSSSPSPD